MGKKFDMLNMRTGDIFVTANKSKYLRIVDASYNFETADYTYHDRNGKCPKNKKGEKDIVQVLRMPACPDANKLSEALKLFKNLPSKYTLEVVWEAEDPAVTAAKKRVADLKKALNSAESELQAISSN